MARSRRRESDTAAIAKMPAPPDNLGPEHHSVSIRKIDNGYVATHSHEVNGEYHHREEYHEKRPDMEQLLGQKHEEEKEPEANHLKGAIDLMKNGRA